MVLGVDCQKPPCTDTKEKGCKALDERVEDQCREAAGDGGRPSSSAHCHLRSRLQPTVSSKAKAKASSPSSTQHQKAVEKRRISRGTGPPVVWGALPHAGGLWPLKSFLLSQLQRGILASC